MQITEVFTVRFSIWIIKNKTTIRGNLIRDIPRRSLMLITEMSCDI